MTDYDDLAESAAFLAGRAAAREMRADGVAPRASRCVRHAAPRDRLPLPCRSA